MAEVDTSSYKQDAGKSPLEIASDFGKLKQQQQAIQRTDIGISSDQLELMKNRWAVLNKELSTMVNEKDITPDKVVKRMQNMVKMNLVTPDQLGEFVKTMPADPKALPQFLESSLKRGMSTMEAMEFAYGKPYARDTGQRVLSGKIDPRTGAEIPASQTPHELPPTTQTTGASTGQPQLLGVQPPPVQPTLPVGPVQGVQGQSNNFGGNVISATREPATPQPRLPVQQPVPSGPTTAPAPMFEIGKKQLAEDQELATQKLTAIKPAMQVLPLLKDLRSGPTTETFTRAVATLKANGIIPTGTAENDPTAIRQIVNKKLADYVRSNPVGQRSDAAQHLSEKASPTASEQINPALVKLTKDAIVLDRVQAARAGAFTKEIKDKDGKTITVPHDDLSKYGNHRSTFPARVDERAFGIDLMEPAERKKLLDDMVKKKDTFEGKKFWKSLQIVKDQGLIDTGGQ